MATASPNYTPPLSGGTSSSLTPPATIDGTGLTTSVPLLIKNAKPLSGVELQVTGTAATGYLLRSADAALQGVLGLAVAAGDWVANSAAGDVVITGPNVAGKRLLLKTLGSGGVVILAPGSTGPGVGGFIRCLDGGVTQIGYGSTSILCDGSVTTVNGPLAISASTSLSTVAQQVSGDPNTGNGAPGGADTYSTICGGAEIARFGNGGVGQVTIYEPGSSTKLFRIQASVAASGERPAGNLIASSGVGIDLGITADLIGTAAGRKVTILYYSDQYRSALEIANTASATLGSLLLMKSGGDVVIGGSIATNATQGFPFIPSCAGPPTGVPAGYSAGTAVALAWDRTNKKLYVYDGSWVGGTTPGVFI